MASPREMLARCAAGAGGYEIRSSRVFDAMTAADIAAAVSRVKTKLGQHLVLYLWADHAELEESIISGLLFDAVTICLENGWTVRKPGTLSGILRAGLRELKSPRVCRSCNGSGVRAGTGCAKCGETGRYAMSSKARARLAGMSPTTWQRWATRYDDLVWIIDRAERAAIAQMRASFGA